MSMGNLRLLQQLLDSHSDGFTLNQILSGTDIKIKHIVLSCTKLTELWVEVFKTRSCRVCPSLCFPAGHGQSQESQPAPRGGPGTACAITISP